MDRTTLIGLAKSVWRKIWRHSGQDVWLEAGFSDFDHWFMHSRQYICSHDFNTTASSNKLVQIEHKKWSTVVPSTTLSKEIPILWSIKSDLIIFYDICRPLQCALNFMFNVCLCIRNFLAVNVQKCKYSLHVILAICIETKFFHGSRIFRVRIFFTGAPLLRI